MNSFANLGLDQMFDWFPDISSLFEEIDETFRNFLGQWEFFFGWFAIDINLTWVADGWVSLLAVFDGFTTAVESLLSQAQVTCTGSKVSSHSMPLEWRI